MEFTLYYRYTRVGHGKFLRDLIIADNSKNAFLQAKKIMETNKMQPEDFTCFYISSYPDAKKLHGWDEVGDLPRKSLINA